MKSREGLDLTEVCANDLLAAFKLPRVFRPFAAVPARRFARNLAHFDQLAETTGIVAAGRFLVESYSGGATWSGAEYVPSSGPLIIASNHPGMCDAMALWMAAGRNDLKVLAAERDLLKLLPNVSKRLIIVKPGTSDSIREASAHLKQGGALLTFPAGQIEPDPALRSGCLRSLDSWSASVDHLARQVQGAVLTPALVTGALSSAALASPLVQWLRDQKDRDWAGATLQILFPAYRRNRISIAFGPPLAQSSNGTLRDAMEGLVRANPHLLH